MFEVLKKTNILILALLLLSLALVGCVETKEGLIAKVEGEEITEEQLKDEYEIFKGLYIKQFGEDAMTQKLEGGRTREELLKEQLLEKIIMEKIIEKQTDEMDISVSDEEVEEKTEEYIKMTGGEEDFNEFLKNNDLTKEYFSENLRKEILVNKHRSAFLDTVEITDKEARKFFEDNKEQLEVIKASHILVKTEEQAQEVLDKINDGEDFEELAKTLSVDKASGLIGGDLGYFTKGTRIPEFEEVAFSMEKGEISDIVKTEVGYHIIKLVDRKDVFEELKDEISMVLKESKYEEEMKRLRNNSKVKIY